MRTFKTKAFARFSRKAGLGDIALCEEIAAIERGLLGLTSAEACSSSAWPGKAKANPAVFG